MFAAWKNDLSSQAAGSPIAKSALASVMRKELPVVVRIDKRFYAKTVTRRKQSFGAFVPNNNCKLAPQVLEAFYAVLAVQVGAISESDSVENHVSPAFNSSRMRSKS